MSPPRAWSPELLEILADLVRQGLSHRQIAKRLGISKSAAGHGVRRYIQGKPCTGGKRYRRLGVVKQPHVWTERALTEPWEAYRARKARERAARAGQDGRNDPRPLLG